MSFLKRFRDVNAREILGQWEQLTDVNQLDAILEESKNQPVAIFKHSTSCGISHHVKSTLEEDWDFDEKEVKVYLNKSSLSSCVYGVTNIGLQKKKRNA